MPTWLIIVLVVVLVVGIMVVAREGNTGDRLIVFFARKAMVGWSNWRAQRAQMAGLIPWFKVWQIWVIIGVVAVLFGSFFLLFLRGCGSEDTAPATIEATTGSETPATQMPQVPAPAPAPAPVEKMTEVLVPADYEDIRGTAKEALGRSLSNSSAIAKVDDKVKKISSKVAATGGATVATTSVKPVDCEDCVKRIVSAEMAEDDPARKLVDRKLITEDDLEEDARYACGCKK